MAHLEAAFDAGLKATQIVHAEGQDGRYQTEL
jgi:hypothetical protein